MSPSASEIVPSPLVSNLLKMGAASAIRRLNSGLLRTPSRLVSALVNKPESSSQDTRLAFFSPGLDPANVSPASEELESEVLESEELWLDFPEELESDELWFDDLLKFFLLYLLLIFDYNEFCSFIVFLSFLNLQFNFYASATSSLYKCPSLFMS
jgi:hypothetical protein